MHGSPSTPLYWRSWVGRREGMIVLVAQGCRRVGAGVEEEEGPG